MINKKVIICGICKNTGVALPFSTRMVEKIGSMFEDYRVFIYENNSTDNTKQLLTNWQLDNKRVSVELEDVDETNLYINSDYLKSSGTSRARNKVVDRIKDVDDSFTHVIWIDMDFVKEPNYEGFNEIFETDQPWDAVFAYGINPPITGYWDWLPFRDYKNPFGPELLGHYKWYVAKDDLGLKETDPWYPVYSAFGGCGVYRREALKDCRYSAEVTPDMEVVIKQIIKDNPDHPVIKEYLDIVRKTETIYHIIKKEIGLPKIKDYDAGIYLNMSPDAIMWRLSSFVFQYPCICDHMGVHYTMLKNGFNKLFINPRLIFRY